MSATEPSRSVYETNKQIAVMVDMVDGCFDLDEPTLAYMRNVRAIIATAARDLTGHHSAGVALDQGQMNAAIQLLQQAKNKACDAAIIGCETRKRAASAATLSAPDLDTKKRKEDVKETK